MVDFRPMGGGLAVVASLPGATPESRLRDAVLAFGEPCPGNGLLHALRQGRLHVLHREQHVDAFQPLSAPPPVPLVVLWRRTSPSSGYMGRPGSLPSVELSGALWPDRPSWLVLGSLLWGLQGSRFGAMLGVSLVFGTFLQPEDDVEHLEVVREDPEALPAVPTNALASLLEHSRLASRGGLGGG